MGLRKLTQWEETVAKQEQKQFRLMSVAIVCVIAMCVVLWLVQDQLYGDVVRTGAAAYGCSFIGVAIGLFVRSTTGETWATSSEKRKKFEMALIGIFIVLVIGGAIFLEEFRLAAVQLLFAYLPIFWILKKRKTDCDENCLLACMFPDDGHGSGRHLCRRKADGADNPANRRKEDCGGRLHGCGI